MKKSLYEISKEALSIALALENGELTEELESQLVINQNELQTKSINYGFVIKESDHNIDAIDKEIKRLQLLKKSEQNKKNRLLTAVSDAMKLYSIDKIETPVMKLSFRSSKTVEVISMSQIPNEYKVNKTTTSADKKKIKEAIENGETVEGAVLNKNQTLQIK